MLIKELPEVGLAQPSVDAAADLDAQVFGHRARAANPPRQVDLAEPALAEQAVDAISQLCFRTHQLVAGVDELLGTVLP